MHLKIFFIIYSLCKHKAIVYDHCPNRIAIPMGNQYGLINTAKSSRLPSLSNLIKLLILTFLRWLMLLIFVWKLVFTTIMSGMIWHQSRFCRLCYWYIGLIGGIYLQLLSATCRYNISNLNQIFNLLLKRLSIEVIELKKRVFFGP